MKIKVISTQRRDLQIYAQLKCILKHNNSLWSSNGWFDLNHVIKILHLYPQFANYFICIEDINRIVTNDSIQLFEIKNNKIRAKWGHSVAGITNLPQFVTHPPKLLYTTNTFWTTEIWMRDGIDYPKKDVILYPDPNLSFQRARKPCGMDDILLRTVEINAHTLVENLGTEFRTIESGKVFLTKYVHPAGIREYKFENNTTLSIAS
jgi:RNA:NAD 2'-phosphotransferase (TPT1/KptA family)